MVSLLPSAQSVEESSGVSVTHSSGVGSATNTHPCPSAALVDEEHCLAPAFAGQ